MTSPPPSRLALRAMAVCPNRPLADPPPQTELFRDRISKRQQTGQAGRVPNPPPSPASPVNNDKVQYHNNHPIHLQQHELGQTPRLSPPCRLRPDLPVRRLAGDKVVSPKPRGRLVEMGVLLVMEVMRALAQLPVDSTLIDRPA
jgi:hypothetical protein